LVQIALDPMGADGGVRQLEPPAAKELVQPLLIVDGKVQARSLATATKPVSGRETGYSAWKLK
jgi:hypothetical protein